jgi:hypothetical protein
MYAPTLPKAGDYDIGETAMFYSILTDVIRLLPANHIQAGHCNGNQDLVQVLEDEDSSEINLNGEAQNMLVRDGNIMSTKQRIYYTMD